MNICDGNLKKVFATKKYGGWAGGSVGGLKAILRIAHSNQKYFFPNSSLILKSQNFFIKISGSEKLEGTSLEELKFMYDIILVGKLQDYPLEMVGKWFVQK